MRLSLILVALLPAALHLGCSSAAPKPSPTQQIVEARLADVLAAASAPEADLASIARFCVARGDKPERRWKAPADLSDPSERAYAQEVTDGLFELVRQARQPDGSLEYEVVEFVVESESEGVWHVLEVDFVGAEEPQAALFAFLPVAGDYYLGEFER